MATNTPPSLAKLLLTVILPAHVTDEICGDLEEEFQLKIQEQPHSSAAHRWYWHQALNTSFHYSCTTEKLIPIVIMLFSLIIFFLLYSAIALLSYGDKAFFVDDFWYNGNVHLLFLEAKFWHHISDVFSYDFSFTMLMNKNAMLWSLIAFFLLMTLKSSARLSVCRFTLIGMVLMFVPYLYGVMHFYVLHLPSNQVGPLIAFMWLPLLYLICPVAYLVSTKFKESSFEYHAL